MKLNSKRTIGTLFCFSALLVFYLFITYSPREADMLLVNGIIHTLDPANSVAEAIALRGNKIVAVGSTKVLNELYEADRVIDLHGNTVMPGLIDSHGHMRGLGQLLQSLILYGIRSPEAILDSVKARVATAGTGVWILGRGWDQNLWDVKDFPDAAMLDRVAPNNPVVLIRVDGHAIWVNSKAMELAGVTRDTKDPAEGKIVRDQQGNPSGIFLEDEARSIVESAIPPRNSAEIEDAILLAVRECARVGLTEVCDLGLDHMEIAVYKKLSEEGRLPIRIYGAISVPSATWDEMANEPPIIGLGGGMFTLRAMKMYADGALGSRGAALIEQYSDDPGNRGVTTTSESKLDSNIRLAVARGYQPCIHAIGDRANHMVLNSLERVLGSGGGSNVRPRIEHVQVLAPDDIPRFKKLQVLPGMQPVHATSDMYWAEARLGRDRVRGAYAWRSLLESGSMILSGSDFPNDAINPLWGFYAGVTRSDRSGYPQDGWYPLQKMTREEAARSYTVWAAYGTFEEQLKGTLEPGKLADLTILSKDIMTIPPKEILTTDVVFTIVNGRIVYERTASPVQ